MATDMAAKLETLYPPARNKFKLQHGTPDDFGAALVEDLRRKGYALAEFDKSARSGSLQNPTASTGELNLAYVVDQPLETGLYRVTVFVNTQSLSRLYQFKDGDVAPAGYWVRKE